MDEDTLVMDAHAAPPPGLKELYKRYQKMKLEELDSDPGILDFDRAQLAADVEILKPISSSHLEFALSQFMNGNNDYLPVTQDAPVYGHHRLPGLIVLPGLLSINVQKSLLSRLLHRDLSDNRHKTNLHLHYKVAYPKEPAGDKSSEPATGSHETRSFFSYSPAQDTMFLPKDTTIHRPLPVGKVLRRSLRWITLGGQYDWTNKIYPDEKPPPFPPDIAGLLNGLFPSMKPQAAIVNLYSPGDTLSLHRDVSEKSQRGLVSISIGCDCLFVIGNRHPPESVVLRLRSGDGVYMAGDARFAWHGVPRILPDSCPPALKSWPAESGEFEGWRGWMSDKRINLNVRQMND